MIAHILNYKDRDSILRAARDTDTARIENQKISIYPDYTNREQVARKAFLEAKAKLHSMGLRYMLLYTARLKVILEGTSCFFDIPKDVWQWLEGGTKHLRSTILH
ncbi:hypothetical protein NDU88_005090 [Pleurodeles waltl]|uniref:Uncharacterized protein n=1 Tax=Pleurodeles waltl TaxID=8319 RepID=A0AAV7QHZ3_PLEWA|nr:hypothetical protein NDU88_005090 [Pleurodeles waltl]